MMSRVSFIFIVSLFTIAALGGAVWFFFFYQGGNGAENIDITISDFLSLGKTGSPSTGGSTAGKDDEGNTASGAPSSQGTVGVRSGRLLQLSPAPVAGYLPRGTSTPSVRFIERATGHVYDINADGKERKRVSNTTIPRIYEAYFGDGGNSVVVRYLDDEGALTTYAAAVTVSEAGSGELKGRFLPEDITDLTLSPDGKKTFFLLKFGNGANGFTSLANGASATQIFTSYLTEWLSSWQNEKMITLTTKASGGIPGYAYKLDPATRSFEKILGGIQGLTTLLDPTGKQMLYSVSGESGLALFYADLTLGKSAPANLSTLPEKCVWAKGGSVAYCAAPVVLPPGKYPDAWYQGTAGFSDRIWAITPGGGSELAADLPKLSSEAIDGVRLSLSTDEKHLYFMNKKDNSLWTYDMTGQ
ncbi:hypothetical protein KW797_01155 [Candidatus Parcubacteria bacterium]|nr:hypothetical protein [Candidatus Parcubacteria bacterium]